MADIEEIKRILAVNVSEAWYADKADRVAQQIRDLYKGDGSGLLADEAYRQALKDAEKEWIWNRSGKNIGRLRAESQSILQAQASLTASILEKDHQLGLEIAGQQGYEAGLDTGRAEKDKEIAQIFKEIEKHERIGLEFNALPDHIHFTMPIEVWQAIKSKFKEKE